MDSVRDGPRGPGFPIRTSTDQSLLAAPRGLSQRATSFIASRRQGIHQTPFSARDPHPQTACRPDRSVRRQDKGAPRRRQHARPPFRGARALPSQSGNTSCAYWRTTCPNQCLLTMSETALPGLRRTGEPLEAGECLPPETWWSRTGSNRRPPACKAGALPTELRPLPGHLRALRRRAHDRAAGRHRDKWWAWIDLNYRPHPYQGCALTD